MSWPAHRPQRPRPGALGHSLQLACSLTTRPGELRASRPAGLPAGVHHGLQPDTTLSALRAPTSRKPLGRVQEGLFPVGSWHAPTHPPPAACSKALGHPCPQALRWRLTSWAHWGPAGPMAPVLDDLQEPPPQAEPAGPCPPGVTSTHRPGAGPEAPGWQRLSVVACGLGLLLMGAEPTLEPALQIWLP